MVPRARGGSRASRPSSCPLLHTRHSTVCTSGQGRLVTANLASDFAHAIRQRVHERTGAAPFCQSRVRLCTRAGVPCAQTDARTPESASACPTLHTPLGSVCTNGQDRLDTANLVSDFAHAQASRVHKRTRPVTIRRASVRLRTRTSWSRADAGIEASGPTSAHPKKARVAGSRTRQKARPVFPGRRRVRMCTPRLQPRANAPALAAAPHASATRRGLPEMGARHACLVACSTNRRALRTPSRTPSPREARACHPVICGTIH